MPTVSVVIPTYNRINEIKTAIYSVLSQSHQDTDVIVVDDASADDTRRAIRKIKDTRVRFVRHHQNLGVSCARNTGIGEAVGDYVAFLDSDDRWHPQKLNLQLALLENTPDIQAVTCSHLYLHNNGVQEEKKASASAQDIIKYGPQVANVGSCLLIRQNALLRVGGFCPSMSYNEDYDWLLRFVRLYPNGMAGIQEPLVLRSGSEIYPPAQRLSAITLLQSHTSHILKQFGVSAFRSFMSRQCLELAFAHHQSGNHARSMLGLASSLFFSSEHAQYFARRIFSCRTTKSKVAHVAHRLWDHHC